MSQPESEPQIALVCILKRNGRPTLKGEVTIACFACERLVTVSRQGQAQLAKSTDTVVLCIACALAHTPDGIVGMVPGSDAEIRKVFGDERADRVKSLMGRPLRDLPVKDLLDPENWSTGRKP